MSRLAAILLALALVPLASVSSARAQTVHLATLEWPPYIGEALPGQGYVAEAVREAFARSGLKLELHFRPWKRTLEETRQGRWQGYVPEYFSRKLTGDFIFSTPFFGGPLVLLTQRGTVIDYETARSLMPLRVGVVRGYVNTREIDTADFLDKHKFTDDLTNLRMLRHDRVDVAVIDLFVARYLADSYLNGMEDFTVQQPALDEKLLYVCFPRMGPDTPRLLVAFEKGLASMRADGTLEAIRQRHGLNPAPR